MWFGNHMEKGRPVDLQIDSRPSYGPSGRSYCTRMLVFSACFVWLGFASISNN